MSDTRAGVKAERERGREQYLAHVDGV